MPSGDLLTHPSASGSSFDRWRGIVVGRLGGESILTFTVIGAIAAASSLMLVFTDGDIATVGGFVLAVTIVGVTIYRLELGFLLFVGCVLLCDQEPVPGNIPVGFGMPYFQNLKGLNYLQNFEAAVVSPLELHILLLMSTWVIVAAVRRRMALHPVRAWFSGLLFFGSLVLSLMYGLHLGGDFLTALWELRALFYFCIMYYFVPQIIQTESQLKSLLWVVIAAVSFKAFQGIVRFVWLGFSFQGLAALTVHEEPVFFVSLIIFLLGLSLFRVYNRQQRALLWLLVPLFVGFIVAQRRAAYASFAATLLSFLILMPQQQWKKIVKIILPAVMVFALYLGAFWNGEGKFASVAKLVRSSLSNDPEDAGDRYYSNLYRLHERYNLAITIRRAPLKGVGFGNRYDSPIPLPPIKFPLREYIPHNEVLWLLVKMGAVGFFCFWVFTISYVFRGASVFSQLRDPYLKAVCAVCVTIVINQLVVSYFDLQLTYYRNMIYLGILMGLLPTLEILNRGSLHSPVCLS